jgi:hypothetical protein
MRKYASLPPAWPSRAADYELGFYYSTNQGLPPYAEGLRVPNHPVALALRSNPGFF